MGLPKYPTTNVFGQNRATASMIRDFVAAGLIEDGYGRALGPKTIPLPKDNEVVVFRDLFTASLRFPLVYCDQCRRQRETQEWHPMEDRRFV